MQLRSIAYVSALSLLSLSMDAGAVAAATGTDRHAIPARPPVSAPLTAIETVLHSFAGGTDGATPYAGLSSDAKGNLYGTTQTGGTTTCGSVPLGCGTVFKLSPSGKTYTYATIFRFKNTGANGAEPFAGVIADASGNLYGTASAGGVGCTGLGQEFPGCGLVFELKPSGKAYVETVLHKFDNNNKDGYTPIGGLIRTSTGVLRGTASAGGPMGRGIVFKLTPSGNTFVETILYNFQGTPAKDGSSPMSGLVEDAKGALYGTTYYGGANDAGSVFKMTPSGDTYTEKAIHSFTTTGTDGAHPVADVVVAKSGAVFGLTPLGGKSGNGVAFELAATSYAEKILHTFAGAATGDGAMPNAALTLVGTDYYGTTVEGGSTACVSGCGVVFKLAPKGTTYAESVVYEFGAQPLEADGGYPESTLLAKGATLFGTASIGGSDHGSGPGPGVVFSLVP